MTSVGDFERCYAAGRDRLAAQLYALTGSRAEAVEAVQEAWARAWERWEVVGGYDDPEAWVRQVAYRVAVSRWRRVRRLVRTDGPDRAMDDAGYDRVGASDALVTALRTLPRRQQRALVLHYLAGLPVSAVAAELGVAEGTAKSLLWRGRRRLAARLGEAEVAPGKEVRSG